MSREMSREMSRDLAHLGQLRVVWRVALSVFRREQVHSRHRPNRTENPRVGGSIPSLATVWGDNFEGFEPPNPLKSVAF